MKLTYVLPLLSLFLLNWPAKKTFLVIFLDILLVLFHFHVDQYGWIKGIHHIVSMTKWLRDPNEVF